MGQYIKQAELAAEIAKSKLTFCWFRHRELTGYDEITEAPLASIETEVLAPGTIYRVHSDDWVPRQTKRRRGDDGVMRDVQLPIRLNFPAFQHWCWTGTDWLPVARSHYRVTGSWHDDTTIPNGEFCQTHGRVTDRLGSMYLLLVSRFATKANWRNYSWREEMELRALELLIQNGLKFNEARSVPPRPFGYLGRLMHNAFLGVLEKEKRQLAIVSDLLNRNGLVTENFGEQAERDIARYAELSGAKPSEAQEKRSFVHLFR